ncbi:MAG TPA: heme ABC exporter ATP-binding protein CcmA [Candidatus Methylomirabilis sp.]|nr:heme ABC exporter ATP-binding protein CcmA [Candidatus Methylomirabilis sp.]
MIKATRIRRTYGPAVILDEVSLTVDPAECVLLLGPNGAGKTTLLRILATLLRPTGGTLIVNGIDAVRFPDRIRALIGMVAHGTYAYEDLTALENLRFWTMMQAGSATRARLHSALVEVGLDAFADERVRMLSAGMKRRLALARVMLGEPRVLLLDEPFTGLDARGRTWLGEFLRTFKSTGGVVVMVSHSFGVALEVADRVAILCGGRLAFDRPCGNLSLEDLNKLYDDLTESIDS